MHVSVLGAGYVGLVTAACLAEMGNRVGCIDVDEQRIGLLLEGQLPHREPGLQALVVRNVRAQRLNFHADQQATHGSELVFVAVGTLDSRGEWTAAHVRAAVELLAHDAQAPRGLVVRSTLLPGTAVELQRTATEIDPRVHVLMADALMYVFPGAQFIHIVRDGRMVVNSMLNFGRLLNRERPGIHVPPWSSDFAEACRTWRRYADAGMAMVERYPDRCWTVRNENLEVDPEGTFDAIFRFLRLAPDRRAAEFARTNRVNSSFEGDISAARTPGDVWAAWTDEERGCFMREAGQLLGRAGYSSA